VVCLIKTHAFVHLSNASRSVHVKGVAPHTGALLHTHHITAAYYLATPRLLPPLIIRIECFKSEKTFARVFNDCTCRRFFWRRTRCGCVLFVACVYLFSPLFLPLLSFACSHLSVSLSRFVGCRLIFRFSSGLCVGCFARIQTCFVCSFG